MRYIVVNTQGRTRIIDSDWDLILEYTKGDFNGSQKVIQLGKLEGQDAMIIARAMRELGDYVVEQKIY